MMKNITIYEKIDMSNIKLLEQLSIYQKYFIKLSDIFINLKHP